MRINNNPGGNSEPGSEDNAGGFSAYSWQSNQLFYVLRDFAMKAFYKCKSHAPDVGSFVSKEAQWLNDAFHIVLRRFGQRSSIGICSE